MAKNFVWKDADYLSAPVPPGTLSGEPLRLGGLNAVAQTDEGSVEIARANALAPNYSTANGASSNKAGYASVAFKGAVRTPVVGAVNTYGQPIYWNADFDPDDPADAQLTTAANDGDTPTPNPYALFGHAISLKAAGVADAIVRIHN